MHAIVYVNGGMKLVSTHPKPQPNAKDKTSVLVKVHAASINPVDYHSIKLKGFFQRGHIVGHDFSGEITYAPLASPFEQGEHHGYN